MFDRIKKSFRKVSPASGAGPVAEPTATAAPFAHARSQAAADPAGNSSLDGKTTLLVRDGGKTIAELEIDLASLQADAEVGAAGGDPIAKMEQVVQRQLHQYSASATPDGAATVRRMLNQFAVGGLAPASLVVAAKRTQSGSARPAPGNGEPHANGAPSKSQQADQGVFPPELFELVIRYPNPRAAEVYAGLIGLDDKKVQLVKEAIVLTNPRAVERWAEKHHRGGELRATAAIRFGTPLVIFAGDVGTGKSALAETFGEAVARELGERVLLLRMSIATRGAGYVGDMTKQITRAISCVEAEARRTGELTILLLDEADAMAESRETKQMHHEDRAGVNALIQGVDRLRGAGLPVLVVFCTNRLASIDPAIQRRAVDTILFERPSAVQRRAHLERLLEGAGLSESEFQALVALTGPRNDRPFGFTYSDISDRLVRGALIEAFPNRPLSFELVRDLAATMLPTRPFAAQGTD